MKRSGITQIAIENFKGIRDRVEIPLRPITMLFGANSAGKSTILQALLYLRELLERQNVDADRLLASGASINLGGFRQFVHQHDLSRQIKVGVTFDVDEDGLPVYPIPVFDPTAMGMRLGGLSRIERISLQLTIQWDFSTDRPWITEYEVGINGRSIGAIAAQPNLVAHLVRLDAHHPIFDAQFANDLEAGEVNAITEAIREALAAATEVFPEKAAAGASLPLESRVVPEWGKPLLFDFLSIPWEGERFPDLEFIFSQIFVGAGEVVLRELQGMRYIGPIRQIPSRNFQPVRSPLEDRWVDGSAAWDLLFAAESELDWLDIESVRSLGLGYRLEVQRSYEVSTDSLLGAFLQGVRTGLGSTLFDLESEDIEREVRSLTQRTRVNLISEESQMRVEPHDVGVGISQVLPVVIGAMAPGYRILSVEQPELHIHPAVQCRLGDVLAHQAVKLGGDRILLLETHSEHLMLRLLRRVRESHSDALSPGAPVLTPEHLSILYVTSSAAGVGITELPVTAEGDFARQWPEGFFEERAEELF